jgi:phage shock protein PspC (stress-responsive transcriptional regulator)
MNKKYLVRKSDKLFTGICSGLASYLNINALLVRLATLVLFYFFSLEVTLIYLLAWMLILPEPNEAFAQRIFYRKIKKSSKLNLFKSRDSILFGVCKGISINLNLNVVGIRLLFGISFLILGLGAVLYIVLAISLPSRSDYEVRLMQRIETLKLKISERH